MTHKPVDETPKKPKLNFRFLLSGAWIGGFVFCILIIAGLPPLSGFIAKFAIVRGLLDLEPTVDWSAWWLIALIIASGLATVIAASRAGIDLIWAPSDRPQPVLRLAEAAPVGLLLTVCLGLIIFAGPAMRYMERTAQSLADRQGYIQSVLRSPGSRGEQ